MLSFLKGIVLAIASIFIPIKPLLLAVVFLLSIDFLTGMGAANHRGELITSAGWRRTVTKLLIYELAIICGFITETYLSAGISFSRIAAMYVGLTELKSIIENLNEISGENLLSKLLIKLGSINDTRRD